jgi:hypothetical protein
MKQNRAAFLFYAVLRDVQSIFVTLKSPYVVVSHASYSAMKPSELVQSDASASDYVALTLQSSDCD